MKFTLNWLKDHLDTDASLEAITETLTKIGLEVENITDKAKALAPFVIAKVLSAEQHPNADKLRVCMVDVGDGKPLQVVCGAPNARTGMMSVFSPPGTYIPAKNITLSVGNIRGVESHGMLCSEFELDLSQDHDGIIDLPQDAPLGVKYADYAGLNDPVIEINLTPNRPDCTSIFGIARDLAAAGLGTLKTPAIASIKGEGKPKASISIETEPHFCPVFALREIKGVNNKQSPKWVQERLKAIGLRPINALVDITNFITFDRGRPLHVFDADKVKGNLKVRHANACETFLALDTKTYTMLGGEVVICDDNGIESLAGIMGGEHSGCDENTKNVLIESALWDPLTIARTGRNHSIITDARYRFERGIDPAFNTIAVELATAMVLEFCSGQPTEMVVAGQEPDTTRVIEFPISEVERLTGVTVDKQQKYDILTKLGFKVEGEGEVWQVTPPSWRGDVEGKADLVEEIIRIVGLDSVVAEPIPRGADIFKPVLTTIQKRMFKARRLLASRGMLEGVTWSFISHDEATQFGGGSPELQLANPIAADLSDMRPTLLAGLLKAVERNNNKGLADIALFEVGQVFANDTKQGQTIAASGVRTGLTAPANWQGSEETSVFHVKQDAFSLLSSLGVNTAGIQMMTDKIPSYLHPNRACVLQQGPQLKYGVFGELHPKTAEKFGIKQRVFVFELNLEALPEPKAKPTRIKAKLELSPFMPLTRDYAFVVDKTTKAADLVRIAGTIDKKLIENVTLFDVYEGKGVADTKKSLGITVTLQPVDKTLTEEELDAFSAKMILEIGKKLGGVMRG